ncbi:protocadherin alpha-5-like isoform X27 [Erpetoichthys calabaricus]|uniref:protocadherin alpha-5-like isoform X27 n=1 Tax=Erpetoichthys calabaricus TaxID=27687 RepID=UPI00223443FE|nr:protocadherin alpha-5-like isoform X27 [Erpetoichthys calabaricus]
MPYFHYCRQISCRHALFSFLFIGYIFEETSSEKKYIVLEEVEDGVVVGNVAKDFGFDLRNLQARIVRIVSGLQQPLLQVNKITGDLYVTGRIDREQLCDRKTECIVNLKLIMETPLEIHYIRVEVKDINDHSPTFSEKEKHFLIPESAQPGMKFLLEPAHDRDVGINSIQLYQLSENEHFVLVVQDMTEDNKIPVLILQKPLDREQAQEHALLLTAFDGGEPKRSGYFNIVISVQDINDNAPVFENDVYKLSLKEDSPIGTFVVKVNASDLDEGVNSEITFFWDNSVKSHVKDTFTLDNQSGEIKVKGMLDFEEIQKYQINVIASDRGSVPLSTQCTVIIEIEDVNDNIPEIDVTSSIEILPEDAAPGTTVALITVTDRDSGVNGEILCTLDKNLPFGLKSALRDGMYSLVTKLNLDRETTSQYTISIKAKDKGMPSMSSTKNITVTISDINDNSPKFSQGQYSFYIFENNVPGASVFAVNAVDTDENENSLLTYYFESTSFDRPVYSLFSINSQNGVIYASRSFDFEEIKNFTFLVFVKDHGVPTLKSNVTINVFILDQNDNAPVILSPRIKDGFEEIEEEIPRNAKPGHFVTKIRAYDADVGYNALLLFLIEETSDSSVFTIQPNTGEVRTRRHLTDADSAVQKLIILVKDHGRVSFSTSVALTVTVVEGIESLEVSDIQTTKYEEENSFTFYLIIGLGFASFLLIFSILTFFVQCCRKSNDFTRKPLNDMNYSEVNVNNGTLCHSFQYRAAEKAFMFVGRDLETGSAVGVDCDGNTLILPDFQIPSNQTGDKQLVFIGPGMNRDSMVEVGSNTNTLLVSDSGIKIAQVPKQPNTDWRYSASLRAGMQSSVHMEESAVLQGPSGVHIQNWPTVSSATPEPEAGEVSPPVGAGINSNSWTFKYGPPAGNPQQLKPGEVPENFIIPGSPAIISIRQGPPGAADDKSDFITFGKKEETKKKKKKKKGKADKKEKSNDGGDH